MLKSGSAAGKVPERSRQPEERADNDGLELLPLFLNQPQTAADGTPKHATGEGNASPSRKDMTPRSDPIRKPYKNQQVAVTEEGSRREQLLCKCGKLNKMEIR